MNYAEEDRPQSRHVTKYKRKPNFVCEECRKAFGLQHLKVDPGSILQNERNLCKDCYKGLHSYL